MLSVIKDQLQDIRVYTFHFKINRFIQFIRIRILQRNVIMKKNVNY